MIFYFSGTGNSKYAAEYLAKKTDDSIVNISEEMSKKNYTFTLKAGERVGFVFPIYAWTLPKIIKQFIANLSFTNISGSNYIYSVITCGSDVGKGFDVLDKSLKKRKIVLSGKASLTMPDNYIVMYDTNTHDEMVKKVQLANARLSKISESIIIKKPFEDINFEGMSSFKTYVIAPFFNKFLTNPKKFYAESTCTKCGLCEKICPTHNIKVDEKPVWGDNCTVCLACIHRCPAKAIQYGKGTKARGRYYFDTDVKIKP